MKKLYFLIFMSFGLIVSAQNNITFSVDMTGQTFTQAYVSGSFNGWSGDANPLNDMGGGIWEVTLPIADGEYEYKFTYDNWTGQDTFTQGDVCTITNYGNTNRRLVVNGTDRVLATAPFNGCAETSSNPGPHSVTLTVDMSGYGGGFTTVYVNGENYNSQGFGAWCGACGNELFDQGGGIWSRTFSLEEYAYQFKFTVDGWNDQEMFTPGDPITSTDGTFTNRYLNVDSDKSLSFTWSTPPTLSLEEVSINDETKVYPNPTQDFWNIKTNQQLSKIQIFDIFGKNVLNIDPSQNELSIDATNLRSGVYFARIETVNGINSIKLIKQ